jgi:hypothetical protein
MRKTEIRHWRRLYIECYLGTQCSRLNVPLKCEYYYIQVINDGMSGKNNCVDFSKIIALLAAVQWRQEISIIVYYSYYTQYSNDRRQCSMSSLHKKVLLKNNIRTK